MEKEFFMKMAKSFMRETLQEEISLPSLDIMVKGLFTTKMEIQNVKASGEKTTLNQELYLMKMGQNFTKERSIMNTKKMKSPTLSLNLSSTVKEPYIGKMETRDVRANGNTICL